MTARLVPRLARVAKTALLSLAVVASLLVFPNAVPWMIAGWLAVWSLARRGGRGGWLPLALGTAVVIAKLVPLSLPMVSLGVAIGDPDPLLPQRPERALELAMDRATRNLVGGTGHDIGERIEVDRVLDAIDRGQVVGGRALVARHRAGAEQGQAGKSKRMSTHAAPERKPRTSSGVNGSRSLRRLRPSHVANRHAVATRVTGAGSCGLEVAPAQRAANPEREHGHIASEAREPRLEAIRS